MNKRKILIITSSVMAIAGASYFTYSTIRNKKEIKEINAILDSGAGAFGSIIDFRDIFNGYSYIAKYRANHPNLILLKNAYVTAFRKALFFAMAGAGTNENTIKQVFSKLKDKVQIAQVAQSYQQHYKENLLNALISDMNEGSDDMKELLMIIKNKPAYRIS